VDRLEVGLRRASDEPARMSKSDSLAPPHSQDSTLADERRDRAAPRNYDLTVRSRGVDDVALRGETDTFVYGDGGTAIDVIVEPDINLTTG
jgi:hypothetical protein